jgi:ubiquinone/menaquinone biosynthesis C-methylase UbiE
MQFYMREKRAEAQDKEAEISMFDGLARQFGYDLGETNVMLAMLDTLHKQQISLAGTILELGCGTGAAGHLLLKHNRKVRPDSNDRVIGLDISPESVRVANEHRPDASYTARVGDLEDAAVLPAGQADAVMCCGVLHHFSDCSTVIRNLSIWAADNATLVILEPNGDNPSDKVGKFLRHMIELVLGKKAVLSHQLATPNETGHAIATYRGLVKQNGWTIEFETSFTPE